MGRVHDDGHRCAVRKQQSRTYFTGIFPSILNSTLSGVLYSRIPIQTVFAMGAVCLKPDGGFCFIPVMMILRAWRAYKAGIIRFLDLRVWLACFELKARRCKLGKGRVPRYMLEELHDLVGGVGGEHLRQSLNRLGREGLLRWSETSLTISNEPGDNGDEELHRMAELVVNVRRKLPLSRRVLRFLVGQKRPVLVATVLGHHLRCVYYRRTGIRSDGLVKVSEIADLFSVDERNVKRARASLVRLGMFKVGHTTQRVLNRYGLPVTVSIHWVAPKQSPLRHRPPPRARLSTTSTPPLKKTGNSLARDDHQELRRGSHGVRTRTIGHIDPRDLRSAEGLERVWNQAVRARLCTASEAERANVFAAGAHAMRVATRNPAGLLASIIVRKTWHHISSADEDAGRRMLKTISRRGDFTEARPWPIFNPRSDRGADSPHLLVDRRKIRDLVRKSLASVEEAG